MTDPHARADGSPTVVDSARAQLDQLGVVLEEARAVQGTATREDKAITVVVGPDGTLLDVRLRNDAIDGEPAQLAREIKDLYAQACADARAKVAQAFERQSLVTAGTRADILGGRFDVESTMRSMGMGAVLERSTAVLGPIPKPTPSTPDR
ncbi:MAG: YbaB/EbfC family nucleoid-associated protein [Actinomycetes bacterium]